MRQAVHKPPHFPHAAAGEAANPGFFSVYVDCQQAAYHLVKNFRVSQLTQRPLINLGQVFGIYGFFRITRPKFRRTFPVSVQSKQQYILRKQKEAAPQFTVFRHVGAGKSERRQRIPMRLQCLQQPSGHSLE